MSHFYAMLYRMKYINRWGLMRNTQQESICEHSLEVAILAHALAVIHNRRFHGNVNPERAATLAIFHDAPEIITGDLPTPVKYYNPSIHKAYQEVEKVAQEKLLSMLPQDLKQDYTSLLFQEQEEDKRLLTFVKAADKLSALIKCVEERKMGNAEFTKAEQTIRESINAMNIPEADCFIKEFLPSYELTLDEQE